MTAVSQTAPAGGPVVDQDQLTRAQKALLALTGDVAKQLAEDHGVCVRPLAMRRIDLTTGRVDVVPVPCGSTREEVCRPCADKARRLRMAQCREGWHLEDEPVPAPAAPTAEQKQLMATRADLHAAYTRARADGDEQTCEEIRDAVAELDEEIRALGVRGRLAPLDPPDRPAVKRSTRRRQDAPNLPRRPVENRTVGRVYGGRYRPSTFLTLTLDSYGRVDGDGAAVDPDAYDYRRAARDAIHFPKLVDRFWQNTRRCVGWDVQYFGTVEPQKRLLVLLTAFCSLRWGEVSALRRCDIADDGSWVRVTVAHAEVAGRGIVVGPPKSRAGIRTIVVPEAIRADLVEHLRERVGGEPSALVFTGDQGRAIRRTNFSQRVKWTAVVRKIGVPGLHFHDLRHAGNVWAAQTKVSTRDLMARMGHDDMRAALIYQRATQEAAERIARGLSDLADRHRAQGSDESTG